LLVLDETRADVASVVGEECHIVSGKPEGPRFDASASANFVDDVDNLVLLCRVHHKNVDDQTHTYDAAALRATKLKHEAWVESRLEADQQLAPVRIRPIQGHRAELLVRVRTGTALFRILDGAAIFHFDHDDAASQEETDLIASFLQSAQDWADLSSGFEAGDKVKAAWSLGEELRELESHGFWVFGGREPWRIEGGTASPSGVQAAVLRVVRQNNPDIISTDASESKKP
jgi:hypothetical protein